MLTVGLPDGSEKQFEQSTTAAEVAADIGPGLAKAALAAEIDGTIVGLDKRLPEEGRVELLRSVGRPYQALEGEGIHFPVREVYCRYWALVFFDDLLRVTTNIEKVGGASVRFGYRIVRKADDALIADAHTHHACVDDTGKVRRLPPYLRGLLGK